MRILMLGAVLSALSNLLFAWLSGHGHDVNALIAVVSADNLSSGIASAAFIAYLSSLTNVQYSATQYALPQLHDAALAQIHCRLFGVILSTRMATLISSMQRLCWGCLC